MSLGDEDAFESAKLFVEAVNELEIRAIIQGWEAGIKELTLTANIYAAGPLPHSWLLPHCAGLVHHGGYGTTAAGLRAGIPALIIPHIADQFYWGQTIHELGIGPQPIPRTKLNREKLINSLNELIQNEELHTSASAFGMQIRSENGVENAVRLIEETFVGKSQNAA
jgi:UDP:flavonoid glycosyltransferase YjiC (YdhE family)